MFTSKFNLSATGAIITIILVGFIVQTQFYSRNSQPSPTPTSKINLAGDLNIETANPSPIPSPNIKVDTSSEIKTPKPTLKPTVKPTSTPTPIPTTTPTPKPIADYFADVIKVHSSSGYDTTITETDRMAAPIIEATFKNPALTEGSSTIQVSAYYDGQLMKKIDHAEYGGWAFTFSYLAPNNPGTHTVKMIINESKTIPETNYSNNEQSISFTIIPETVPPNIDFDEVVLNSNGQTCIRWKNLSDNATYYLDMKAKWKIDSGSWSNLTSENPYGCISGTPGSSHTYYVHAEDLRGNVTEKSQVFTIANP